MKHRTIQSRAATSFLIGAAALVVAAGGGAAHAAPGAIPVAGQSCALKLALQLSSEFPGVSFDSRTRPGVEASHAQGRAVDAIITDYTSPHQIAKGNSIVRRVHALAAAGAYPVEYTLWRQEYRPTSGPAQLMEDRGSATQNHFNHIHMTLSRAQC